MRLYNLQLHGAFHPKGLLTSESTNCKGIIHPPLRGIYHWKAASFKWSSAVFPNHWLSRVGKKRLLCLLGPEQGMGWQGAQADLILNPAKIVELL